MALSKEQIRATFASESADDETVLDLDQLEGLDEQHVEDVAETEQDVTEVEELITVVESMESIHTRLVAVRESNGTLTIGEAKWMHLAVENACRPIGKLGGMPAFESYTGSQAPVQVAIERLEVAMEALGGKIETGTTGFFAKIFGQLKISTKALHVVANNLETAITNVKAAGPSTSEMIVPASLSFGGKDLTAAKWVSEMNKMVSVTEAIMSNGITDFTVEKEGVFTFFNKYSVQGLDTAFKKLNALSKNDDGIVMPNGSMIHVTVGERSDFKLRDYNVTVSRPKAGTSDTPLTKDDILKGLEAALKSVQIAIKQLPLIESQINDARAIAKVSTRHFVAGALTYPPAVIVWRQVNGSAAVMRHYNRTYQAITEYTTLVLRVGRSAAGMGKGL